jgi:hypothetical protein
MNTTHDGPTRSAVEQLERELLELRQAQTQTARSLRRWRLGTLLVLIGALALGVGIPNGLRTIRAQGPPGAEQPPLSPVKIGRYYINVPSICYAYWSAQRPGMPAPLVVEFSSAPRLTLSGDEANTLVRLFPTVNLDGQPAPAPVPPAPPGGVPAPGGYPSSNPATTPPPTTPQPPPGAGNE